MKKKNLSRRLLLNKETISDLNTSSMRKVLGGEGIEPAPRTRDYTSESINCSILPPTTTYCHEGI